MIRVLIIDDHTLVRRGLREILRAQVDVAQVGEARDGAEGLALLRTDTWDLVVLDISMAGMSGIDVLRQIRLQHADLPVIMLSMHDELWVVRKCFELGAKGYVTKEAAPKELMVEIRAVLDGTVYINRLYDAAMKASDTLESGNDNEPG